MRYQHLSPTSTKKVINQSLQRKLLEEPPSFRRKNWANLKSINLDESFHSSFPTTFVRTFSLDSTVFASENTLLLSKTDSLLRPFHLSHKSLKLSRTNSYLNDYETTIDQSMNYINNGFKRKNDAWLMVLLAGQVLSFLLACGGAAQSSLSVNCGISIPAISVGLTYFCLSFCLVPVYFESQRSRRDRSSTQQQQEVESTNAECNDDFCVSEEKGTEDCSYATEESESSTSIDILASESTCGQEDIVPNVQKYGFLLGSLDLAAPAYVYLLVAMMDVAANYFTVLAFKYTTITSVTLLDALAIPSSMILSRLFLNRTYTLFQLVGVSLCMTGIAINVFHDYSDDKQVSDPESAYPFKIWGDLFALMGGVLFGAVNVVGEVAVQNYGGPNEYIGMLGFFGTILCTLQVFIFGRNEVSQFSSFMSSSLEFGTNECSGTEARLLLLAFVLASSSSYIGAGRFLQYSEAAFFNLSLLTADFWSVIFSIVALQFTPKPLFFVALCMTVSGVVIYELSRSPSVEEDYSGIDNVENERNDEDGYRTDQANDHTVV